MSSKKSCYLFLGSEIGKKQAALKELRDGLAGKYFEEISYYAGETPVTDIVSAMRNLSLFSETRLFLLKNAGNIKKKEDIDLLVSYIESPADSTFLVLISEENSISKIIEKSVHPSLKRVFYELSDQEKTDWVKNFFGSRGFNLTEDAVSTVLELVENNTEALRRECSRLAMFLDKNTVIGAEEAEKWLSHTREESAFTLFSRIACNDFSRSLETLRILMAAKIDPAAILSGLLWCFRRLRDYVNLRESGTADEGELRRIGITNPGARRDYSNAYGYYDLYGAESLISLAAQYDMKIRQTHTFPKYILMDEFLYKIHFEAIRQN